ncbi:MAG: DUF448 domain-containing protein [Mariprofundaceae bacterium]|nr:DUF448 domain-containing protein [Mariprofundaceae bacterium]
MDGLTKPKHRPERTCFLCWATNNAPSMLRLAVDEDGELWPDLLHKAPGRGSYFCMQSLCFSKLNDRSLGRLKRSFPSLNIQYALFIERLEKALIVQLTRHLSRLLPSAALGRDAVMHRMWHHAPLILIVSDDAGEAIKRQVHDAASKRRNDGDAVDILVDFSTDLLAKASKREKISVVAVNNCNDAIRLQQFSTWLTQVKDAG